VELTRLEWLLQRSQLGLRKPWRYYLMSDIADDDFIYGYSPKAQKSDEQSLCEMHLVGSRMSVMECRMMLWYVMVCWMIVVIPAG
jgi:hypothetical protein